LTDLHRPEPLAPTRHDRSSFDSGEPALDEWLRRYAGQNRRRHTAATWVIATPEDRVAAYASLAMTAIDRSAAPAPVARHAPDPVPALLLGRLAVDLRHAGLGVGTALSRPPSSSTPRPPAAPSSSPPSTRERGDGGIASASAPSTPTPPPTPTSTC
jgi:hypothetical protein